jgi:hypothetical protein
MPVSGLSHIDLTVSDADRSGQGLEADHPGSPLTSRARLGELSDLRLSKLPQPLQVGANQVGKLTRRQTGNGCNVTRRSALLTYAYSRWSTTFPSRNWKT